ncbi:MAG TPA: response regulator transcription factor, partial [Flavobacteriia bacterium]|nr:response regulator transcription factor [Flavobacteriia bacterium]
MIKTLIIEDEINVREGLKKLLKIIAPNIKVIAETGFITEAIQIIKKEKPSLIFLDIELEDGSGFDILKQFETIYFKIIFTTAYNQYAINAFKFSATDYLLKPINPIELKKAIQRATIALDKENLLTVLKHNLDNKEQKIVLKTSENQFVINVKNIIHLEADGTYTHFITTNKKIIVSKNIKFYEDLLNDNFFRCHQSHLVNS